MTFFRLLRMEFWKLARRGRTYIGPAGLLAIVLPTAIGLKYGDIAQEVHRFVGAQLTVIGSPINALFLTRVVMPPTVFLFLPLFVSLVAGDEVSGEAGEGTLRGLLSRPVTRMRLITAKFVVSLVYAVACTAFLACSAFAIGWMFFGLGGLVSFGGGLKYFGMQEGLVRLALSYGAACGYVISVSAVAFLLSVFTTNSLAPVGGTMALMLVSGAIMEIPYFEPVRPYLFTTYADLFLGAYDVPLDPEKMWRGLGALAAYTAGCFAVASFVFTRKDVLT